MGNSIPEPTAKKLTLFLREPAWMIPVLSVWLYLVGAQFLGGYLDAFGVASHWFDPSITRTITFSYNGLAFAAIWFTVGCITYWYSCKGDFRWKFWLLTTLWSIIAISIYGIGILNAYFEGNKTAIVFSIISCICGVGTPFGPILFVRYFDSRSKIANKLVSRSKNAPIAIKMRRINSACTILNAHRPRAISYFVLLAVALANHLILTRSVGYASGMFDVLRISSQATYFKKYTFPQIADVNSLTRNYPWLDERYEWLIFTDGNASLSWKYTEGEEGMFIYTLGDGKLTTRAIPATERLNLNLYYLNKLNKNLGELLSSLEKDITKPIIRSPLP